MLNKPARCRKKFWIFTDAQNHYCYNAMPYFGKYGDKLAINLGAMVVKTLVEPLHNSGRYITCDRYFTGVEAIETLYSNNVTVSGTIMANQKHLPVELTKIAGRLVGSTLFAFKDDLTMCSCGISLSFCYQLLINMTRLARVENQK